MIQVWRILRFSLVTADAARLGAFYQAAFGCEQRSAGRASRLDGGAIQVSLALGCETVELLQYDIPGAAYPPAIRACDLRFQHLAIVVSDMAQVWQHLRTLDGWSPITVGAPQTLPASSGGVTAFKFRDPEGHPLELLEFPASHVPPKWQGIHAAAPGLGIDHSAISVSNIAASVDFYESLGLKKRPDSDNHGPSQGALDGLDHSRVAVTPLMAADAGPHLELLCYRDVAAAPPMAWNDIACTKIIFEGDCGAPHALTDPDGHHSIVVPASQKSFPTSAFGATT
ncbi:MAG: VOC family protein [Alphaproteobacteria bacterium]|nr:VOC family protein [Alphaproteobacteria bacterium]